MTDTSSSWVDDPTWKRRWEKLETLHGGGQGEAYRARLRSGGKIGFLKTIKSNKDPERRARLFREASAYDSFGVEGIPRPEPLREPPRECLSSSTSCSPPVVGGGSPL
jgi:eukaryotic-like serine/threonine-protein kinase